MVSAKESKSNCVFCKILKGELAMSLVYEDDKIVIFPTIEPVNPGHLLIIPKAHTSYLADLEEDTAGHIMKMARRVASAIRRTALKCEGINIFVADGEAAGQEVFHFHLHIYPRFQDDGFGFRYDASRHFIKTDRTELDRIAGDIRSQIEIR